MCSAAPPTVARPPSQRVAWRARGARVLVLVAALALGACGRPELGRAEGVHIAARADGGGELVADGWPRFPLSPADVAGRSHIEVTRGRDDVVAFRAAAGGWVNVVWLGGELRRAPVTPAPASYEVAVGALVGEAQAPDALVGAVRTAKGSPGVARVLARAAASEGETWELRLPKLLPSDHAELKRAFAPLLSDPSASPALLSRAVRFADPSELTREELVRRLSAAPSAEGATARGGLGAAVLLRVLAVRSPEDAGRIGCAVLGARKASLREPDPEQQAHVDAALLGIARAGISCDKVDALVAEDPCAAGLRCSPEGPLLANQSTDQREPVCDGPALLRAIGEELARPPAAVVTDPHPGRTSMFAFAAHTLGKRPALAAVDRQQARRRYAVTQPTGPECDSLSEIGKACHASEAALRDQACRNEGATIGVGTLRFQVDDAKRTISGVETAPAP